MVRVLIEGKVWSVPKLPQYRGTSVPDRVILSVPERVILYGFRNSALRGPDGTRPRCPHPWLGV